MILGNRHLFRTLSFQSHHFSFYTSASPFNHPVRTYTPAQNTQAARKQQHQQFLIHKYSQIHTHIQKETHTTDVEDKFRQERAEASSVNYWCKGFLVCVWRARHRKGFIEIYKESQSCVVVCWDSWPSAFHFGISARLIEPCTGGFGF